MTNYNFFKTDTMIKSIMLLTVMLLSACNSDEQSEETAEKGFVNLIDENRMTLVLSVPSVNNDYYQDVHQQIVDFHIAYAKAVMHHDNIVVVADAATMPLLEGQLPNDILLEENIDDIWMRDFTTVIPSNPIQFNYRPSYFENMSDATFIQNQFRQFSNRYNVQYRTTNLILDGGNIVDNNNNMAITTTRFLEDNNLTHDQGVAALQNELQLDYVAIIPYDDAVMGHADGMVMFADDNTVLVNIYDEPFRTKVLDSLANQLPEDITIVEVPAEFDNSIWDVFASACGVNLNSVVTHNHIYTPVFDNNTDNQAINIIQQNTSKTVHTIPAKNVCFMGGSVRCLAWQIEGENARKIIEAAQL